MINPSAKQALNRVPVAIITGFFGSGKTTLINHLVTQPSMEETALIINEFGEIGLDNLLIETAIENTLLLENGCICCSIRGDLVDTISDLFAKVQREEIPNFSRILIETTGLANPGPIVKSIQSDAAVVNRCRLGSVITMVDGVQGSPQIVQHEEAVIQIAQADIALISKSDLAADKEIDDLTNDVLKINPTLVTKAIKHGQIDPDFLFQDAAPPALVLPDTEHHHHGHQNEFNHGDVSTWSLVHDGPIDEERLRSWLSMLFTLRPFAVLRMKGFVRLTNCDQPLLLQAVGNIISPPQWRDNWPGDMPQTQLVFIVKGVSPDALRTSFQAHVLNSSPLNS